MDEGPIDFRTTCWSQVIRLREETGESYRDALETLIKTYWRPVYAYIRRRGSSPSDAEDLTQAFFLLLIRREAFRHLERDKGSFRGYLCTAIRHFLVSENRKRTAKRRSPGDGNLLGLENLEEAMGPLPGKDVSPELEYQRQWAREVIRNAVDRMRAEYEERDKAIAFRCFQRYVLGSQAGSGEPPSHVEIAAEEGVTAAQVNNYVHRGKVAFQRFIRLTVAEYVTDPDELDAEIEELRSYFG